VRAVIVKDVRDSHELVLVNDLHEQITVLAPACKLGVVTLSLFES
jgi:hypothetical protein